MINQLVQTELSEAIELSNAEELSNAALLGLTDAKWGLDLVRQSSTFTRASTVNVWGYNGDPSASNGPVLISVPSGIEAIEGGRYIDSVAGGAALGSELLLNTEFNTSANWALSGATVSGGKLVGSGTDAPSSTLNPIQSVGDDYQYNIKVDVVTGNPKVYSQGGGGGQTLVADLGLLGVGVHIINFTSVNPDNTIQIEAQAGTFEIDSVSVKDFTPKFLTTLTDGSPMHPYTATSTPDGIVNVFTAFADREDSTIYLGGEQRRLTDDNGIKVWATAAAGTSDTSAPSFSYGVDSTVTDNTVVWTIGGLATIDGTLLEDSSQNVLLQSRDPNTTWTQRGTFAAAQNLTGADGVANSGWTLSGIGALGNDIFQTVTGLTTASRYEPSFILKQIDTAGVVDISDPTGGQGQWRIDLSKLSSQWETVDRDHSSVTIVSEFDTLATTQSGLLLTRFSGAATLSVGYHNSQLELGEFSSSQIETTTAPVTRAATTLSDTTSGRLTAASGAGRIVVSPLGLQTNKYVFESRSDINNRLGILITSTTVRLWKIIGGTTYGGTFNYTHSTEPFEINFYYNEVTGSGIRAFTVGSAEPAFLLRPNTDAAQIGTSFHLGSTNAPDLRFQCNVLSCELSASKEDFGW